MIKVSCLTQVANGVRKRNLILPLMSNAAHQIQLYGILVVYYWERERIKTENHQLRLYCTATDVQCKIWSKATWEAVNSTEATAVCCGGCIKNESNKVGCDYRSVIFSYK